MPITEERRAEIRSMVEQENPESPHVRRRPKIGKPEALLRGLGQGISSGFMSEVGSGLGAIYAKNMRPDLFEGETTEQIAQRQLLAEELKNQQAAKDEPWAYHGADILASILLPVGAVGKGASMAKMAKAGFLAGVLQGAGRSNEPLFSPARGRDAVIGGVAGAALSPIVGKTIESGGRAAKKIGGNISRAISPKTNISVNLRVPKNTPKDIQEALIKSGNDVKSQFSQNIKRGLSPKQAYIQALSKKEGVRLSAGDITQDLALQAKEEDALKGILGLDAQRIADDFRGGQSGDIRQLVARKASKFAGGNADDLVDSDVAVRISDKLKSLASTEGKNISSLFDAIKGRAFINKEPISQWARMTKRELLAEGYDIEALPSLSARIKDVEKFVKQANVQKISFRAMENYRRRILKSPSGSPTEAGALSALRQSWDELTDDIIDKGLIDGDPNILRQIKNARQLYRNYRVKFFGKDGKSAIGKIINKGLTPEQTMGLLIGQSRLGAKSDSAKVVAQLKNALGDGSEEFSQLKAAGFLRLVGDDLKGILDGKLKRSVSGSKMVNNVENLMSKNRTLFRELYTDNEQQEIINTARLIAQATIKQAGVVNNSNSANVLGRIIARLPFARDLSDTVSNVRNAREVGELISGNIPAKGSAFANTLAQRAGLYGAIVGGKSNELISKPIPNQEAEFSPQTDSRLSPDRQRQIYRLLQQN